MGILGCEMKTIIITCTAAIEKAAAFIYSFILIYLAICAIIKSYPNVFVKLSRPSQCHLTDTAHAPNRHVAIESTAKD